MHVHVQVIRVGIDHVSLSYIACYHTVCQVSQVSILSSGQKIATFQHNISQHCWVNILCVSGHPVVTCSDILGVVGSNLKMVKFFMQHLWMLHDVLIWPNTCNMLRPTMLRSVAFKCYDHLAGACKCWANIVGICCVKMLLSFGRGFREVHVIEVCMSQEVHQASTYLQFQ